MFDSRTKSRPKQNKQGMKQYLDSEIERIQELIASGNHETQYITNEILLLIARILYEKKVW